MKTFNLINETIQVNQVDFIGAINSNEPFAITIDGEVTNDLQIKKPLIFKGSVTKPSAAMGKAAPISDTLGKYYKIKVNGPKLDIEASMNWQEIIGFNMPIADYDDTTGDGISHFPNKDLEDMGWHATEFDLSYRNMVEHLEANCEGTLLCIHREEPYQFSGLGFFDDMEKAKKVLFDYCVAEIKKKLETDDFDKDNLEDDEQEAFDFFKMS